MKQPTVWRSFRVGAIEQRIILAMLENRQPPEPSPHERRLLTRLRAHIEDTTNWKESE